MAEGILGLCLGAILGEVEGFVVLNLFRRRLEKEGWTGLEDAGWNEMAIGETTYWGDSRLTWRHAAAAARSDNDWLFKRKVAGVMSQQ